MSKSAEIIDRACEFLIRKAYPKYDKKTCGKCAKAVREAFSFALNKNVRIVGSAKNCGPVYEELGFKKVFSYPLQEKALYKPKIGDISIIQYEPHGHICVLTPKGWISDFMQIDMYGGKIRDKNPLFDIYRYSHHT
jgi:hypothetical protein